jgi:hypothetical protein
MPFLEVLYPWQTEAIVVAVQRKHTIENIQRRDSPIGELSYWQPARKYLL